MPRPCTCDRVTSPAYDMSQCRPCWLYKHDSRYRCLWSDGGPPVVAKTRARQCLYLGTILEFAGCGCEQKHVRDCSKFDRCTLGDGNSTLPCCANCNEYAPGKAPPSHFTKRSGDALAGVAIGSYGWPALAELQVRVIRHHCGDVPILLCDDASDEGPAFREIAARYPGVTFETNKQRLGHTGGDLAVFFKAALWGRGLGLAVVAKLSQRFIVDRPRWLQDGAAELLASTLPLATQQCTGRENFPLRTEACLLDVRQWCNPRVLADLSPRTWGAPYLAEHVLNAVLKRRLGGVYWPWSLIGQERYAEAPCVLWHCSTHPAAYHRLAEEHGLTLDRGFHTNGWQNTEGYNRG